MSAQLRESSSERRGRQRGALSVLPILLAFWFTHGNAADFGEAPSAVPAGASTNSYKTTLGDNGARHTVVPGVQLGTLVSEEADGVPVAFGSLISSADNDGVIFNPAGGVSNLITKNPYAPIINTVVVNASAAGYLNAWIDFNQNGLFEASDQVFMDQPVTAGDNTLTFSVPSSTYAGLTYARFRFTTQAGVATSPTGLAPDGEVEDYSLKVTSPITPSSCRIGAPESYGLDLRWYDPATSTLRSRLFQRAGALKDGTLVDLLLSTNRNVNSFNGTLPLGSGQSISFPANTTYTFTAQFFVSGTNTPLSLSAANLLTDIDGTSSTVGSPSGVGNSGAEHVAWNSGQVFDAQYDSSVQLYQLTNPFTGVADAASASSYTDMAVGKYGNSVEGTYPSNTAKAVRLIYNTVNSVNWQYYSGSFGGLVVRLDGYTQISLTCPDVTVNKSGSAVVRAGDDITYHLTVSNTSNSLAPNTTVTDAIPANTSFVSATSGGVYDAAARTITWALGTLPAGASQTLTAVLRSPDATAVKSGAASVVNAASVSTTNDTNPNNNSSSFTTRLYLFELSKSVRNVSRNTVESVSNTGTPADVIEYCITAHNYGGAAIANLVINDDVPADITALLTGDSSKGGYDSSANTAGFSGAGYGIRLTSGNAVQYLTSRATDADGGLLTDTGGGNSAGVFSAAVGTLPAVGSAVACFRGIIK